MKEKKDIPKQKLVRFSGHSIALALAAIEEDPMSRARINGYGLGDLSRIYQEPFYELPDPKTIFPPGYIKWAKAQK